MTFSDRQQRALGRAVPAAAVRTRVSAGKELTYIEGWYAVDRANRIFGFDGWDRETIETKSLQAREARGTYSAVYVAKVRITVRMPGGIIVREGHGTGEAQGPSVAEVHDRAIKTAETDATKRALATFGKAFGLALYAGKAGRAAAPSKPLPTAAEQATPGGSAAGETDGALADAAAPPAVDPTATHESQPVSPSIGRTALASSRPRIDKSVLAFPEINRVRDKDHLRYVAAQPCLLCSATPSDAHHVRFAQPRAMGRKVGDDYTVPLCRKHHRDLHDSGNEAAWWHDMGIEPLEIARQLRDDSEKHRALFENLNLDDPPLRVRSVPDTPPRST